MDAQHPIGIFDSGIGGLTVADAIAKLLPQEQLFYFGDTVHLPYGDKSAENIRYYSLKIVKFLLDQGCKMIVIACNSAASTASSDIMDFFGEQVPFVDVVEPLVQHTLRSNARTIGVIATRATIQTDVYRKKLLTGNPHLTVHSLATPLLVPMIEEGFIVNKVSHTILEEYLSYPPFQHIDAMLLACTHYPLIRPEIEAYYQGRLQVWDSAALTAKAVHEALHKHGLLATHARPVHRFYASDVSDTFRTATDLFYRRGHISLQHCPLWENG